VATALAVSGSSLTPSRWAGLAAALLVGTVPFAFLGIALGYWAPARAALPLANLLYLVLAYAGGLWTRPAALPGTVREVSRLLPTRALSDGLVAAVVGKGVDWGAWAALAGFALLFGTVAVAGYRRDEGRRFS
jgi:ABC-2 type transport system permease protein